MEQEIEKKQRRRKKRAAPNTRVVFVLVGAVLLIYLGVMVIGAFSDTPETTAAVHVTVNDSFTADGWFFRDEIPVTGSSSSSVRHIAYSGERVQKDAALAVVYSDEESLALSREIEPLQNRISLLDAALQTASESSDSTNLDQSITLAIQQLASQAKEGTGTALANSANSLRTLSLRNASDELDSFAIQTERDALAAELSALEQQLAGRTTELAAPTSGYYSEVVDGYENVLTLEEMDSLTLARFRELTENPEQVDSGQMLGKMIEGFTWYLAAEIPKEQADRLSQGQSLRVSFTQASMETPVTVYSVIQERGSDTALLIMEGTEFNSELVSMRNQPIEIILATYSGLKVPKEAVRIVSSTDSSGNTTQQIGVYIVSGGIQKFKIISEPLFETEDYYVVEQSATNVDMLVEQDQIIVRGRNLQNNMVVR